MQYHLTLSWQRLRNTSCLYTHHQYIAGFLMVGAFAHGAIFFVRDYDPEAKQEQCFSTNVRT